MSWLKTTSLSFARQLSRTLDPRRDYEPDACYSSFYKHWQQAYDIILKSHPTHLHDDVLGVVNHLEQLSTLLVLEARARELRPSPATPAACLECLLTENLLDKLYEWAILTGKYENVVRLEQLKLFGHLVGHYSSQVIGAEPFLRPLLKLLSNFRNELPPPNVESQLVSLLSQLCVALMQNVKFIDLFFLTTHARNGSKSEFIIVRLLLSSVHREGRTGSAARDALLLCAKMSALSEPLAEYILNGSDACPVLATGLSGLYSLLPRSLPAGAGRSRLTADDVTQVHKLMLFVDSLEFCNAVAQVAHPSIRAQLLDLVQQGFLVPVVGPALLQLWQTKGALQTGASEQAAATLYLELAARCSSPRGLLPTVLTFLLQAKYDGLGVLQVLLGRLDGDCQLSMVALALMETLIDLNCEDVMLELVFKYLLPGHHLATSRHITDPAAYRDAAVAFLGLTPKCCSRSLEKTKTWADDVQMNGRRVLEFKGDDRRVLNGHDGIAMDNLVQEVKFNYGNPNETLIGNYHAYLCDARFEISSRTVACLNWSSRYDTITLKREQNNNAKEIELPQCSTKELDSLISICTSDYETLKTSDTSEKEPHSLSSLVDIVVENSGLDENKDSLNSFGESSGYDSFRYKMDEDEGFVEEVFLKSLEVQEERGEVLTENRHWRASAETIIGPLLSSLLKKAAALLESSVAQNARVTSVVSKLAALPTPLLAGLLLGPAAALRPNVPSLFQILSRLKEEIDELTVDLENPEELLDQARVFLIQREMALVRPRSAGDDGQPQSPESSPKPETPRADAKRRSLSNSFSSMFGRRLSASSPSPQQPTPTQQKRPDFTQESYWDQSITRRSVLNAVLLSEWLKELSALCEEHALRLSSTEDEAYTRSVGL